ncbi:hypothetical protein [Rothia amarae]|uniref:hypothetical protein n=1 Tax=Rothia amarae TaxID=169480 RepID=UPI0031D698CC
MSNNEYPEEIYICCENHGSLVDEIDYGGRQVKVMTEKAYDFGKKHALADTGDWHNLTGAIKAGEPIDFEKLDGQKVRITNGQSSAESKIYRNEYYLIDRPTGWYCMFGDAFRDAWKGSDGWTLWLDGEIPMKKQTAEQLPFGTSFKDSHGHEYVVVAHGRVQALYGNCNVTPAKNIVVAEVVGMYGQKESE